MTDIAIRVEGLSKLYRIGPRERYRTLRDTVTDAMYAPFRRLRSASQPPSLHAFQPPSNDTTIWALKDVSFEVKQGEVVGIIGRNGAGKSTLLKILARITKPTEGRAEIHGRVGSLLEVGTGFHPELTGRENIYLNGAILGMKKAEMERKFVEIVAFAEVEKFIDTPVKHYSSGMYVRLAFAVAAHLEPEILLVDEVLAVGDAAFQKKCLGKMGDVAKEGRTVLFVSHNMAAVSALCIRVLLLHNGNLNRLGPTEEVIRYYLQAGEQQAVVPLRNRVDREATGQLIFTGIRLLDAKLEPIMSARAGDELVFALDFDRNDDSSVARFTFEIGVYNQFEQLVFLCGNDFAGRRFDSLPPSGTLLCHVPHLPLQPGYYYLNVYCGFIGKVVDWVKSAARFEVVEGNFFGTGRLPPGQGGLVLVRHHWEVKNGFNKDASTLEGSQNDI